ncbi:MAG: dihydroorotase [Pseudomonadales bacterium]
MMQELIITRPDDWHIHLRDNDALETTVLDVSRQFGRAIIMPNLSPPIVNANQAMSYRERILAALPEANDFTPLMTIYLTDTTTAEDIKEAAEHPHIYAAKLYPAGATTNSDNGVTSLDKIQSTLGAMETYGLPLLVHGEVTDSDIDIFDREAIFIERSLAPLVSRHPKLKVVLEHITTAQAVEFVECSGPLIAATITAHHLLYNRNHMLAGGIRPHYYCLPILKRDIHQQALLKAATSGNPKFFLGTDSAPHTTDKKEAACGCAGCYTARYAMEYYAEAFAGEGALDKLEDFASHFGPNFYGLDRNTTRMRLHKTDQTIPQQLPLGSTHLTPLGAGETLAWTAELLHD